MKTKSRIVLGVALLLITIGTVMFYVPFKGNGGNNKDSPVILTSSKFSLINVNKASVEDLEKLPGIGPSKARVIVEYREKHGAFEQMQDLLKIPGIGKATLQRFSNMITGFSSSNRKESNVKLIDLNNATIEEIETLPSIGPVKAKAIVDYRTLHGPFLNFKALLKVKGIGPKTMEKIKSLVKITKD